MSFDTQDFQLTDIYLECMCDINSNGTKNLMLKGNEMYKKVGRRIIDKDILTITTFLRGHPDVISLNLPYNRLTNCGIFNLVEYFQENSQIKHLDIMCNDVDYIGVKTLAALKENFPLRSLRINGNKFGDEGTIALSELLYIETPLRYLDISECDITMSGLAYILTGLMPNRGGVDTLEIIDISRPLGQFYHTMPSAHAAEFIGELLRRNHSLKEIHIQKYNFDCHDIELLVDGLMENKTLQCLDLNNNNIADDGVKYLCKYLETGPALKCLMIGANNIKDLGARTLSFSMPYSKIRLLDISKNLLTDDGLLDILNTIKKPWPMRRLFVWGNHFTVRSLMVIERMLLSEVLDGEQFDIRVYEVDEELHHAWSPFSNRYTHRKYDECDYGHPPLRKIKMHPPPPKKPPLVCFKHHVDDAEIGHPLYEPVPEPPDDVCQRYYPKFSYLGQDT